ncbi:MAG: PQQ-dependent sugar dehydrogenase [Bacteroidia bacterium]|nr:PQQ-dependent sugar dehydrogenase [Bacteroidia bacterium]
MKPPSTPKTRISKQKLIPIVFLGFILAAFIPLVTAPPGLTSAEAVGAYMNGVFPSLAPSDEVIYEPAFPNLTFNSPLTWTMHPSQDTVFVGQRDGVIYWFEKDNQTTTKNLFLDLSAQVGVVWDGGFLGMAMHPNFGKAGAQGRNYFYVYYSSPDINGRNDSPGPQPCPENSVFDGSYLYLSRFEVQEGTLNVMPNSQLDMIKIRLYNTTHRGGGLLFGLDGLLYLTIGDQAQHRTAQTMDNNLDGGVLRLDVDMDASRSHAPTYLMPKDVRSPDEVSGVGYWIPNDNPFVGVANTFEEYYTLGHRNPHRMTMDPVTGLMYIGEIGSSKHEEINVVRKGKNYGWPVWEATASHNVCTNTLNPLEPNHELPLTYWPRSEANSITGGYVYRGSKIQSLYGKYLAADYGNGEEVWSIDTQTGTYELLFAFQPNNIISFGQDHEGEVYLLKQGNNTTLYTLSTPSSGQPSLPATLSQTGAFTNLTSMTPAPGLVPYDMIESFWSDNALKKRWMVVPNDGIYDTPAEQISFSEEGEWDAPSGTVFIKHFELPVDDTNPTITKRLETRFTIIDENGNPYGLTYKWRADLSDADLLEGSLDEWLSIQTATGTRDQIWHYPSRSECLTCHNEAVNGILGPKTRYLNKDFTYPSTGISSNQLVTLSHLGILDEIISEADAATFLTSVAQDDASASLEDKARSYLDLNCGYCHRPGTGNRAIFDARLSTPLAYSNFFTNLLNESLGIPNEHIIKKGDTAASVLYKRIHSTDPSIMMPPLAKNEIDEEGSAMIAEWILSLDSLDRIAMGEQGAVVTDHNWTTVNLQRTYVNPVVIAGAPSFNGSHHSTVRIQNVTPNSFQVRIDEWECWDEWHTNETIPYMVMEAGVYTLSNGKTIMAGNIEQVNDSWSTHSFPDTFDTPPILFAQCVTENEAEAVNVRIDEKNVDSVQFRIKLKEQDKAVGGHAFERVSWIALEAGSYSEDSQFEAGNTSRIVKHNWYTINFAQSYGPNAVFISEMASEYGGDASAVRYRNLNGTSAEVKIEEEKCGDTELNHTTEDVSYLIFGEPGLILVEDTSSNEAPNPCIATGEILMERWDNLPTGLTVDLVPLNTAPSSTQMLNIFEIPLNVADNYGARMRGYICPPQTGSYTFWISSDDFGEFWLSTDENPLNISRVCHVPGWTSSRLWTKYPEQQSSPILLEAGKAYYVEAIMKEQGGGDNLAVGWTLPDGSLERPIGGASLAPWTGFPVLAREASPAQLEPQFNEVMVKAMPNPVSRDQMLKVELGLPEAQKVQLQVFNTSGQLIMSRSELKDANLQSMKLSVYEWPSGVYILRVSGNGWTQNKKILVQ